jgi:hypothetical protein
LAKPGNTKGGSIPVPLTSCLTGFGISCTTTDNFCFYFHYRLIQTSQTVRDFIQISLWTNAILRVGDNVTLYQCNLVLISLYTFFTYNKDISFIFLTSNILTDLLY